MLLNANFKYKTIGEMKMKSRFFPLLAIFPVTLFIVQVAHAGTVIVGNVNELNSAISSANSGAVPMEILIKDGTYNLNGMLYVTASNLTVRSQTGNRDNVILQGDRMSSNASVTHIFQIKGNNVTIADMTLQRVGNHIIQVKGESGASNFTIKNCILRDAYEQLLKVSTDLAKPEIKSDNGLVEGNLFEYSAGIAPQYYTGGIDAHNSRNWNIRNNTFKYIMSPSGSASEYAVHFWSSSENNVVENNLIMNCDRGIGFGMGDRGNSGGIIRNNMIYHNGKGGNFYDVAIALETSPNTQVYNNTILLENDFQWAIEYRWAATKNVLIANNITNKIIKNRDSASATVSTNVTNALPSWFVDSASGDLHLATPIASVIGRGQQIAGLVTDFDGQTRTVADGIDIGADEYLSGGDGNQPLPSPTILNITESNK